MGENDVFLWQTIGLLLGYGGFCCHDHCSFKLKMWRDLLHNKSDDFKTSKVSVRLNYCIFFVICFGILP